MRSTWRWRGMRKDEIRSGEKMTVIRREERIGGRRADLRKGKESGGQDNSNNPRMRRDENDKSRA